MFKQTIDNCNLLDLGHNGPKFTWTNKRKSNPVYEHLDRGFGNEEWVQSFPNPSIWHLPYISSDYTPILCCFDNPDPVSGEKHIRFAPIWIQDPTFEEVVFKAWNIEETSIKGKLGNVGSELAMWNSRVLGNVYAKKKRLHARPKGIQNI